ncbi:hypothetical protein ACLOJK_009687 [Asimina triloba]
MIYDFKNEITESMRLTQHRRGTAAADDCMYATQRIFPLPKGISKPYQTIPIQSVPLEPTETHDTISETNQNRGSEDGRPVIQEIHTASGVAESETEICSGSKPLTRLKTRGSVGGRSTALPRKLRSNGTVAGRNGPSSVVGIGAAKATKS